MRCQEIMKKDVKCAFPEQTVLEAARQMRDENVGFLPVCDHSDRVIGTLTDRDITIRVVAEHRGPEIVVSDAMTRDIISCEPDDDLATAEQKMAQHHKSRMIVCDEEGKLAGVISLSDIAQSGDESEAARTLREIASREARRIEPRA